jgi:hypothetical protein
MTPPNSSPTKTAATTHEAMTHHLVSAFFMLLLSIDGAEATTPRPDTNGVAEPRIRTSENSSSETVWKIAEGVSTALLWRQEATDRDSFDPSWPLY